MLLVWQERQVLLVSAGRRPFWHEWLFWLNAVGAVAHLAGFVVALAVAELGAEVELFAPALTATGPSAVTLGFAPAGPLRGAGVVLSWYALSLVHHAFVVGAFATGYGDLYLGALKRGVYPLRWIEYTASSAIMLLGASALLGTRSLPVVLGSTTLMATTQLFGLLAEELAAPLARADGSWAPRTTLRRLRPHLMGYLPFAVSWALVFADFYEARGAWVATGAQPASGAASLWAGFAMFLVFGAVQLVHLAHPRGPALYPMCEGAYVVLSVAAKWTMATLLLFDGLTPERVAAVRGVSVSF